jgi:hypothetical protein
VRATVALVVLLVAHGAGASSSGFVDYLYIEANEGGSSGGHSAIRFGDEIYHFQHESPGVLRLRRDDWEHFRYAYGVLENRTMHVSHVAVSDTTYERLRREFNERYLVERKLFDHRDTLRDDRLLLERLVQRPRGAIGLRAAGFFLPDDDGSAPSPTALALRARVEQDVGRDGIRARIDAVRAELARLSPAHLPAPIADVPDGGYPDFPYSFASRYRDLLSARAALEVLDRALPVRADATWSPSDPAFDLDRAERERLAAFADRLAGELVRLLHSERPDWGFVFLVGLARLETVRASVATGRLVLLDAFPPDAEVVPRTYVARHGTALTGLRADARDAFVRARARLHTADVVDEARFAGIESAGNRLLELDAASDTRDLRVASGSLVPSREAAGTALVPPDASDDELERALAETQTAERLFAERLERRYSYDLITRNCASEIFRTVDAANADPGGHVDARWSSLDFIPFLAAHAVDATWDVADRTTLSSYRRSRLDEMYRHENPLRVWLREGNVLTSTIYRRTGHDSVFLFFTDDALALRPALGAVNLLAGLGAAVAGLPLLPFDRGDTLVAGVRGAVFSLPELAFVNLRKGSFDYVPPDARPDDGVDPVAERLP